MQFAGDFFAPKGHGKNAHRLSPMDFHQQSFFRIPQGGP
jgi:hypothetical protein